jgi:uncharacterized membrane protein
MMLVQVRKYDVWVSLWCCEWFWCSVIFSPEAMYLSLYQAVSAHLLTVMYQMMLRQVWWHGDLGVIWVFWMVLGQFSNVFMLIWSC